MHDDAAIKILLSAEPMMMLMKYYVPRFVGGRDGPRADYYLIVFFYCFLLFSEHKNDVFRYNKL